MQIHPVIGVLIITGSLLSIAGFSYGLGVAVCWAVILLLVLRIFLNIREQYWAGKRDMLQAMALSEKIPARDSIENTEQQQVFAILSEAETDRMPDAIETVSRAFFLGLIGAQDAGKSTFLKHLISNRAGEKQIVIDPHGLPDDYCGLSPVGLGRKYNEIDTCFADLLAELTRRYGAGHYNHPRLNVYIDELTNINKYCKNYREFMSVMLSECRKVNIRIVACMHSKRAKILGIDGNFDLIEGLRFLELKYDDVTGKRWGEYEDRTGRKIAVRLPGPYRGVKPGVTNGVSDGVKAGVHRQHTENTGSDPGKQYVWQKVYTDENDIVMLPYHERESDIYTRYNRGESVSRISRNVYGTKSGYNNAKVRSVLSQYGIQAQK